MAATWPSTLPAYPQFGAKEPITDNTIRTTNDVGPDIVRRRSTVKGGDTTYSFMLTAAQAETFRNFWESNLAQGSIELDGLTTPLGDPARFQVVKPPMLQAMDRNPVDGILYKLSLELRLVPTGYNRVYLEGVSASYGLGSVTIGVGAPAVLASGVSASYGLGSVTVDTGANVSVTGVGGAYAVGTVQVSTT